MVCLLAARIACAESGKPVLPDHPRYGLQHLDDRLGLNTRTVTTFLQDRNFIEYSRGVIHIVNRAGMESAACACYGVIRNLDSGLRAYAGNHDGSHAAHTPSLELGEQ